MADLPDAVAVAVLVVAILVIPVVYEKWGKEQSEDDSIVAVLVGVTAAAVGYVCYAPLRIACHISGAIGVYLYHRYPAFRSVPAFACVLIGIIVAAALYAAWFMYIDDMDWSEIRFIILGLFAAAWDHAGFILGERKRQAHEEKCHEQQRHSGSQRYRGSQEVVHRRYVYKKIACSNPNNNHDHLKHKHSTREDAELEVERMKLAGYEGSERLNVYRNRELRGWFVGRSNR